MFLRKLAERLKYNLGNLIWAAIGCLMMGISNGNPILLGVGFMMALSSSVAILAKSIHRPIFWAPGLKGWKARFHWNRPHAFKNHARRI